MASTSVFIPATMCFVILTDGVNFGVHSSYQAKVANLYTAIFSREEYIGWFQISMKKSSRVNIPHCVKNLEKDLVNDL